jgi:glycosyltransferase involved in cell wall biosynthesis
VDVVHAESRRAGLFRTRADWVVFLDEDDIPDDELLEALVAAQAASGADVVTHAVRPTDEDDSIQLFLGEPGALGLVENQYGVLGLVRSSLAVADELRDGAADPDWALFARLALAGAKIVSLPESLAAHAGRPGRIGDVPGESLRVLEAFEERNAELPELPQLAATLAAALERHTEAPLRAETRPGEPRLRQRIASLVRARLAQR